MNNDLLEALKEIKKIVEPSFYGQALTIKNIATEAIKKWEDTTTLKNKFMITPETMNKMTTTEAKKWEDSSGFTVEELKQAEERAERLYKKHTKNDYKGEDSSGKETGIEVKAKIEELEFQIEECQSAINKGDTGDEIRLSINDFVSDLESRIEVLQSRLQSVPPYKEEGWKTLVQKINDRCWAIHNDTSQETKIKFDAYIEIRDLVYEYFTSHPYKDEKNIID